jgi:PiT family inorganic phosphate transporter
MTRRLTAVRWGIAGNIALAWVLTIPGTMGISAGVYWVISLFL